MGQVRAYGYHFAGGQQLERRDFVLDGCADDQVIVQVAGCGLCHTDIGFITGAVKPRHALPLILGHEISGTVVAAGSRCSALMGRAVIVPAVLPCGDCDLCWAERDNICQKQRMPGNDFHGGFASHVVVPGRFLCVLPDDLKGFSLAQLSVVADAVTTPYQSLVRSRLRKGDVAIVIGTGGIGLYMVQHARNAGAAVVAIDIDAGRLQRACEQGAYHGICSAGLSEKEVKDQVRAWVGGRSLPAHQWKVFETSGSAGGQSLAFALLTYAGTVGFVGFTMDKVPVRLSNIMAFDADLFGNWGCRPAHYATVVAQVLEGRIHLRENIEEHPLDRINDVVAQAIGHQLDKRAILLP